ncbi:MAG: cytochrome-c oxidase, cbb3-type subunit III [Rhodospirillales bacterium]|nr:cytochrome-c oxidase, cbb3-type subunit III [Rhodospirillales bacterium]
MDDKKKDIDGVTGIETTGHEWDGVKELNNPAPRWWLLVFYVCVIWSIGYWVVYPAWPTLSGHTQGIGGKSQYKQLESSQQEIHARQAEYMSRFEGASFSEIQDDPSLYAFAVAGGSAAFKDNCATCHGTGGAGAKGFPNLNDDDWLWGGSVEEIHQTITYGIRSAHDDAHVSIMQAYGKDGLLKRQDVAKVVDFVASFAEHGLDESHEGYTIFQENCASCHGADAKGSREFGAPNLRDAIWLYGGDHETIYETVFYGRGGVMPNWNERLDPATIRQLAIYVHSLGGGE